MVNENDKISIKEAYTAMYAFLENEYSLTNSDDIGGLLGGMSLLQDGTTADPAAWDDWLQSVQKALNNECDITLRFVKE